MNKLNNINTCNLNYLNHDLRNIRLSLFKCNICNVSVIFSQNGVYWKVDRIIDNEEYSNIVYKTNCNEECIKKLLE